MNVLYNWLIGYALDLVFEDSVLRARGGIGIKPLVRKDPECWARL